MINMEENYFKKLSQVKCDIEKKNWLSYVSWADGWTKLKETHPEATYIVYENQEWNAFFQSQFWFDVKVWVKVWKIEHIVRLPVLDFKNKSMTKDNITSFDINKSIMRAFAKAIAMHWVGLYVYRWEDLPDTDWEFEFKNCKTLKELQEIYLKSPKTNELITLKDTLKLNLK